MSKAARSRGLSPTSSAEKMSRKETAKLWKMPARFWQRDLGRSAWPR
jgi:hypothetical protein